MTDNNQVTNWIEQVKQGDSHAEIQIWQHYFDRLVRTVRNHLCGQNRAISDEEDIVASVFESFYQAAEAGRFPDLTDRDELWRLLLKMSSRKVIDKRRRDQRQRRGDGIQPQSLVGPDGEMVLEVVGDNPTPEMVAMMAETMGQLFEMLGAGQLKEIAVAKLEGHSNAEIATQLDCSERTVERRLHLIREKLEQEGLDASDDAPRSE
ncbi:ECF-type sigma factor [Rhodopirellula sp. MGV]|uniref:ECF-type sigma factor n=1 Tax=Rhodopirellula sp. MGV TaxID=2023130 RepID=UPI000B977B5B|nr:ECF-type sigma factor [Rhodopirellula sp. MGV]OYP29976.1 RNA polymerase subunit sigma-70 [Rhodopirellula sp. MGV]PNY33432.1 RNA polymerase subunit sigma-70 [Rhodopirellula baltica]